MEVWWEWYPCGVRGEFGLLGGKVVVPPLGRQLGVYCLGSKVRDLCLDW